MKVLKCVFMFHVKHLFFERKIPWNFPVKIFFTKVINRSVETIKPKRPCSAHQSRKIDFYYKNYTARK